MGISNQTRTEDTGTHYDTIANSVELSAPIPARDGLNDRKSALNPVHSAAIDVDNVVTLLG